MPSYTLPPEADIVEALVGIYRASVPQDLGRHDRLDGSDDAYALAEMMAISDCVVKNWSRMGVVSHADGDYLKLLARQSGLSETSGESDSALRTRVQTPPLAITPDLILQAIQSIVDANGGGAIRMIELPRDSMYFDSIIDSRSALDTDLRMGGSTVIILIPASANCLTACTAALKNKRAAGKRYLVEEYVGI